MSPAFNVPVEDQSLDGFETLDSGNVWGYGKIEIVRVDPLSGKLFGVATNSGGQRYPRRMKTFEEWIEHRTSDSGPARTSVTGTYVLTQELADRVLRFEQDVGFSSALNSLRLVFTRRLKVNGDIMREKHWDEQIPRDFQRR